MRYSKLGKVRFVSHRDGARLWERALRRVELPVAVTRGFTPRPRLSFGLALPTGAESVAEYIDIDLVDGATLDTEDLDVAASLSDALPVGLDVQVIAPVTAARPAGSSNGDTAAGKARSLQDVVTSTTWELSGPGVEPDQLASAAERLLAADELLIDRERKGRRRVDDVRPQVLDLRPDTTGTRLVAELATVGRGVRPTELAALAFADISAVDVRILRTHQWIEQDGERREVLSLPVDVDAPTQGVSA